MRRNGRRGINAPSRRLGRRNFQALNGKQRYQAGLAIHQYSYIRHYVTVLRIVTRRPNSIQKKNNTILYNNTSVGLVQS
jgi:hypothetical protein